VDPEILESYIGGWLNDTCNRYLNALDDLGVVDRKRRSKMQAEILDLKNRILDEWIPFYVEQVRVRLTTDAQISFAETVQAFCHWAECGARDVLGCRRFLLVLMTDVVSIRPEYDPDESDADEEEEAQYPRRGHEGYQEDYQLFRNLPIQQYRCVFDPLDLDDAPDEPVIGDLHDDLADIYGDLWHGLQAFKAGDEDYAHWYWWDSYGFHWGHHAAGALYAIDEWCRKEKERLGPNADDCHGTGEDA